MDISVACDIVKFCLTVFNQAKLLTLMDFGDFVEVSILDTTQKVDLSQSLLYRSKFL
jgi:hypothetical protein